MILGPDGLPVGTAPALELPGGDTSTFVGPGLGARLEFHETTPWEHPGGRFIFAPGTYLIIHDEDFSRMLTEERAKAP